MVLCHSVIIVSCRARAANTWLLTPWDSVVIANIMYHRSMSFDVVVIIVYRSVVGSFKRWRPPSVNDVLFQLWLTWLCLLATINPLPLPVPVLLLLLLLLLLYCALNRCMLVLMVTTQHTAIRLFCDLVFRILGSKVLWLNSGRIISYDDIE